MFDPIDVGSLWTSGGAAPVGGDAYPGRKRRLGAILASRVGGMVLWLTTILQIS